MLEEKYSICNGAKEAENLVKVRSVYGGSGCADVGEVAYRVTRKLRADKFADGSGSCLTGIGVNIESLI